MNATPNRISDLLDPVRPNTRCHRTPAQQEASRRNGSRSHGPATAAGKAKSRMNSIKHGLLARVVTPPADGRQHDQLYRQIRQELVNEFSPSTFTQRAAVDALAGDYVQAARIREMIETLQRPPILSREDDHQAEKLEQRRRDTQLLERLVARSGTGEMLSCGKREAERIAAMVVELVDQVKRDLDEAAADAAEDAAADAEIDSVNEDGRDADAAHDAAVANSRDAADGGLDAYEQEEEQKVRKLVDLVVPGVRRLSDKARLVAVLTGAKRPGRSELDQLLGVLSHLRDAGRNWMAAQRDLTRRLERIQHARLQKLAHYPQRLMVLDRYRSRVEAAIEKKRNRLAQL